MNTASVLYFPMSLVDIRSIPGLHVHVPKIHRDVRGLFVKQTVPPCGFIENFHMQLVVRGVTGNCMVCK